jgi:hypothetical protein
MKKDINELSREINDFMFENLSKVKTKEAYDHLIEKVKKAGKELDSKLNGAYNNAKYDKDVYVNINKYLWMQEKFNNYNYAKGQKILKSICSEHSQSLDKDTCIGIDKYFLNEFANAHPDYFEESK